ncbi:MAG: cytochrome d ubiquinol oxidase subunit [Solirubrobacterales bacterium]|nr:cytochrome d ubiquinol oxidase subunit [Solirubrobacterales bacterium]
MAEIMLGLALLALTAYAVLAGADLGAGFWDLTAGGDQRGGRVRGLIQRSMSPVWEANHVWLIFLLVVLWTAFPIFFGSIMSTLYVPLFLAAFGIILRGTAFALRGQAATIREARGFGAVFALSSVLVPFCFGAAIGGIVSGRVPVCNALGDPYDYWLNPTSILIGVLAVVTGTYLSATYLGGDAQRAGLPDLVEAFRRRALSGAIAVGVISLGGLAVLHSDARSLYDGLTSGGGLVFVAISGGLGLTTLGLIVSRHFIVARWSAAAAVASIVVGWGVAQSPYLLPGELTLDDAAAPHATLVALTIAIGVGLCFLVPSLALLYRFVLTGRLDQEFEPLDQRFRPLTADDHPPEAGA